MIVKFNDVTKRFDKTLALDNLNFDVSKGEVIGLLGPNGAGKTTAINTILGLVKIDEGSIELFDKTLNGVKNESKRRIGLVTQEVTVYEDMTAKENLAFFGGLYGLKGDRLKRRIDDVAKLIGLSDRINERPKNYSGGMLRRLNIGCAILHEPELLIMDEPTVGIDPQSRRYILDFVKEIVKTDTTVIYTSHYIEEVEAIATRVVIVDQGHVIANGTTESLIKQIQGDHHLVINVKTVDEAIITELKNHPDIKDVYTQDNVVHVIPLGNQSLVELVFEKFKPMGIESMNEKNPNLEDVFISLTGKTLRDTPNND